MATVPEIKQNVYDAMVGAGWPDSSGNPLLRRVHTHNNILIDNLIGGIDIKEDVISFWNPSSGLPTDPVIFDRYISSGTANGWVENYVYEFDGIDWIPTVPSGGIMKYVEDQHTFYYFNDSVWTVLSGNFEHNHDDRYSLLSHNHDNRYSLLSHNHDTVYASLEHSLDDHTDVTYATVCSLTENDLLQYNNGIWTNRNLADVLGIGDVFQSVFFKYSGDTQAFEWRTPAQTLSDIGAAPVSHAMNTHTDFTDYLNKTGSAFYQASTWIQFSSTNGMYNPSSGSGTHFCPSTATYGSYRITGSKGSYSGLVFDSVLNDLTLMVRDSDGLHGFYNQSAASPTWQWYYDPSISNIKIGGAYPVWHSGNFNPAGYSLTTHDHSGTYEPVFTKSTAFNKNFGSASGTVCQGNDSRLSDARTPLSHTLDSHSNFSSYLNQAVLTTSSVQFGRVLILGNYGEWAGQGAIRLQPSTAGNTTAIVFDSKVNDGSDRGAIVWYDDNNKYRTGAGDSTENGCFVIGVQNDSTNSSSADSLVLESSGDIYFNVGRFTQNIGGGGAPDFSKGNIYVGDSTTRYPIWHSGNFNPANYLPLTGGMLSGSLSIPSGTLELAYTLFNSQPSYLALRNLANNAYVDLYCDDVVLYGTNLTITGIANSGANTGKIAVFDSGNNLRYRIPAEILSETGAVPSSKAVLNDGTGSANVVCVNAYSSDLRTINYPGIYSAEYTGSTNKPSGASNGHFIQITDAVGTDVKTQFYVHNDGNRFWFQEQWGSGQWKGWKEIYHSGNLSSLYSGLSTNNLTKYNGSTLLNSQINDDGTDVEFGGFSFSATHPIYKTVHAGALGLMYRNTYNSYICGNALFNTSAVWVNKYSSYKPTLISLMDGFIAFDIGTGTTAGSTCNFTNIAQFNAAGLDVNGIIDCSRVISSRLGYTGTYDSYQVQGIWSIGNGWEVDTTANDFGDQYGICYAHTNAGTSSTKKPLADFGHQICFTENGQRNIVLSLTGKAYFAGQIKTAGVSTGAPIILSGSANIDLSAGNNTTSPTMPVYYIIAGSNANKWTVGTTGVVDGQMLRVVRTFGAGPISCMVVVGSTTFYIGPDGFLDMAYSSAKGGWCANLASI